MVSRFRGTICTFGNKLIKCRSMDLSTKIISLKNEDDDSMLKKKMEGYNLVIRKTLWIMKKMQ